jgi:hypothetical protein
MDLDNLLQERIIRASKNSSISGNLSRKFSTRTLIINKRNFHTTPNTYKSNENCESMSFLGNISLNKEEHKENTLYLDRSVQEKFVRKLLSIDLKNKYLDFRSENFINIYSQNLTGNFIYFSSRHDKIVSNLNIRNFEYFEYFDFKTMPLLVGESNKDSPINYFSFYSIYNNKVFAIRGGREVSMILNDEYPNYDYLLNKKKIVTYVPKYLVLFLDRNCILLRPILKLYDKLIVPLKFNSYILEKISHLKIIYFALNNSSLVKLFLNIVLEESILIASLINESNKNNNNQELDTIRFSLIENKRKELYNLHRIHRNDYNNLVSGNSISGINISRVKINEILKDLYMKELKGLNNQGYSTKNSTREKILKSKRITAVYLITKDNISKPNRKEITNEEIGFYYIGSSINLESRLKDHISKWKKEYEYSYGDKELRISFIYLNTNYLDKFQMLYPTYNLSKLE